MRFASIEILFYGVFIVTGITVFYIWSQRRRAKLLLKFADKEVLCKITSMKMFRKRVFYGSFTIFSVVFLLLSLARPQWGFIWKEHTVKTLDILIAIDTSKSMLATDVYPDRLRKAKSEIMDFVMALKKDRVGLIAFSGKAFLQCPLTMDYSSFSLILNQMNVNTIPRGGTSLSAAIEEAVRSYTRDKDRVLILITDGENTEGDLKKAIEDAIDNNVKIFCIGIGSSENAKIPFLDENGNLTYLKDKDGNIVMSSLDETVLKNIAEETGGAYIHASPDSFGLKEIYDKYLSKLERYQIKDAREKVYTERFQVFLILALISMIISFFLARGADE